MKKDFTHYLAGAAIAVALLAMATPASAQGRRPGGGGHAPGASRPNATMQSSSPRSSSQASRPSATVQSSSPRSSSQASRPSATMQSRSPQVNRNATPSSPSMNRSNQVSHGSSYNNRPSGGGRSHGGGDFNRGGNRPSGGGGTTARPGNSRPVGDIKPAYNNSHSSNSTIERNNNYRRGDNNRGGNPGGNYRPGDNNRGGNHGGNYRPGGNHRPGGGYGRDGHRPRPHVGGINHGGPRPNYNHYRWSSSFRPRHPHDRWYDHYRYNRWSWRAPIAPPMRMWRPRVVWYYRPVIPVGFRYYASAPIITGVLGVEFGTYLDASLNYLYYNGYNIDGYQDNVVYLRDVQMMGYSWPDVMLQYDNAGGMCYAQFTTSSGYRDDYRFNNLYNSLCSTYGSPIIGNNGEYSWYGGNGTGYINLYFNYDAGRYYTVITFGA